MLKRFPNILIYVIPFLFLILGGLWINLNFLFPKQLQMDPDVHMIAVGDIMLSRHVQEKIDDHHDINYPFLGMQDTLKNADLVFANLENPITDGPPEPEGSFTFHARPGEEEALKNANVSIVSIANNHSMNFGSKGILDTIQYLDTAGISHIGAGKNIDTAFAPTYITKKNITFAFLGYTNEDLVPVSYLATTNTTGTSSLDQEKLKTGIAEAKKHADIVIVSMHNGIEYTAKASKRQTDFAHAAIDDGADLVIGHHPHVVQNAELYKGKYIFYSLGNFIFDQNFSQNTREGMTLDITFTKDGVKSITPVPIEIKDYSQPTLITDETQKKQVIDRLQLDLSSIK